MIDRTSYDKEWIDSLRLEYKGIDPTLCEKMIRALGLLEELALTDLDFVFKGGTSLILLIEKPERFSIDIDIVTETSKESVENSIDAIMKKEIFKRFIEKEREDKGIPKAHYYFYYNSMINGRETFVALDVLFDSHSYPVIVNRPIRSHWIKTTGDIVTVKTPDIDSILGDKLTVFAPNTTGIPYGIGKGMELMKQLFDIGRLFDRVSNIKTVKKALVKTVNKELSYREQQCSVDDVLNDIIRTSLAVSRFIVKKHNDPPAVTELFEGLKRFKSFPIAVNFRIDDAFLSSSKAAYLAALLSTDVDQLIRYSPSTDFPQVDFPNDNKYLSRLEKRIPEAYFYWCKTFDVIAKHKEYDLSIYII